MAEERSLHTIEAEAEYGSSAATKTFAIPELLEHILLLLPLRDLLFAKRISKQFEALITSSRKIRQALFFDPLPQFRKDKNQTLKDIPKTDGWNIEMPHPPLIPNFFSTPMVHINGQGYFMLLYELKCSKNHRDSMYHLRKSGGSWRNMLVIQPLPALTGLFHVIGSTCKKLSMANGLRAGQLVELLSRRHGQSQFRWLSREIAEGDTKLELGSIHALMMWMAVQNGIDAAGWDVLGGKSWFISAMK